MGHTETFAKGFESIAGTCKFLGLQRHRLLLARYMLTRILRNEYGLNRGRRVVGEFWQNPDVGANYGSSEPNPSRYLAAEPGFSEVDDQVLLEELLTVASPAQREAVEVYWEAARSGKPLSDICRSLGRDPNVVRNNFQAFRRKVKAKFTDF